MELIWVISKFESDKEQKIIKGIEPKMLSKNIKRVDETLSKSLE